MRALADTIDENLEALNKIVKSLEALNGVVIELLTHNSSLATEAHRVWVDLREGIADLRGEYKDEEKTKCNCDKCECDNSDDYTEEGDTCEDCFRDCLVTEQIEVSECQICGYNSNEVTIVNNLCSVHTCEVCKKEGYATKFDGDILCEEHEIEREGK